MFSNPSDAEALESVYMWESFNPLPDTDDFWESITDFFLINVGNEDIYHFEQCSLFSHNV